MENIVNIHAMTDIKLTKTGTDANLIRDLITEEIRTAMILTEHIDTKVRRISDGVRESMRTRIREGRLGQSYRGLLWNVLITRHSSESKSFITCIDGLIYSCVYGHQKIRVWTNSRMTE